MPNNDPYLGIPINDAFTYRINNNYYYFNVSLINMDGRAHTIKTGAIKTLVIEDDFHQFFHKGYIVINNSFDSLERNFENTAPDSTEYYSSINNTFPGTDELKGFVFKGDSRDVLRVDIMPNLDPTNPNSIGTSDQQRVFRMYYDFAIYHSEDIEGDNPDEKYKKLYFWDLYYELMRNQNCFYSTARSLNKEDVALLDNKERSIPTGTAIKELLDQTFNSSEYSVDKYNLYFNDEGVDEIWDEGSTSFFFSSPGSFKAIDALNYLLDIHVSSANSNYDQAFLRIERWPRVFTFRSLADYFDLAYIPGPDAGGLLYLENIQIGGFTNAVNTNNEIATWGYQLYAVPKIALYADKIGTLVTFNSNDRSGLFSQKKLTSYMVHSYESQDKMFQIDCNDHDIMIANNAFTSNYVSPFKRGNYLNFNPGEIRRTRKNVNQVFSTLEGDPQQRLNDGRNLAFYNAIFSGSIVSFRLPGSTHRQAGRFIGLTRDGAMEVNINDVKLLGIYFILEVKHVFQDGEYYNEIKCVKTYYPQQVNEDKGI